MRTERHSAERHVSLQLEMLVCCDRLHDLKQPLECFLCKQGCAVHLDDLARCELDTSAASSTKNASGPPHSASSSTETGAGKHAIVTLTDSGHEVIFAMKNRQAEILPFNYTCILRLASFTSFATVPPSCHTDDAYLSSDVTTMVFLLMQGLDMVKPGTTMLTAQATREGWLRRCEMSGLVVFLNAEKQKAIPAPDWAQRELVKQLGLDKDNTDLVVERVDTVKELEQKKEALDQSRRARAEVSMWFGEEP